MVNSPPGKLADNWQETFGKFTPLIFVEFAGHPGCVIHDALAFSIHGWPDGLDNVESL